MLELQWGIDAPVVGVGALVRSLNWSSIGGCQGSVVVAELWWRPMMIKFFFFKKRNQERVFYINKKEFTYFEMKKEGVLALDIIIEGVFLTHCLLEKNYNWNAHIFFKLKLCIHVYMCICCIIFMFWLNKFHPSYGYDPTGKKIWLKVVMKGWEKF